MAGNSSVACAEGRLSLARERAMLRFDLKTSLLFPISHLDALRLSRRRDAKAQAPTSVRRYAADHLGLGTPHMLWLAESKNPPNCVFFACSPQTPAVLTS